MTIKLEVGRTYMPKEWNAVSPGIEPDDEYHENWAATEGGRRLVSVTVTHLAPRTPSWAGAQVVRDALGRVWTINGDGHYDGPMTYKSAQLVGSWGDVTVLIDADGNIPPASLMEVNGVSRDDLVAALPDFYYLGSIRAYVVVDAVLAELEGKR